MARAIATLERISGERPAAGTPVAARTHARLVVEHGGSHYECDYYGDELPSGLTSTAGPARRAVHARRQRLEFLLANGFVTARDFAAYLIDSLDQLRRRVGG